VVIAKGSEYVPTNLGTCDKSIPRMELIVTFSQFY